MPTAAAATDSLDHHKGPYPRNRLREWRHLRFEKDIGAFVDAMRAAKAPLSGNYVYEMEKGVRPISNWWRQRFAKVLQCLPDEIAPDPDALSEDKADFETPPPFEEQVPARQALRYMKRAYFQDLRRMVEEVYLAEGAPMPADDYWLVTLDILDDAPFDGETRAADSADVAASLAALRRVLRALRQPAGTV